MTMVDYRAKEQVASVPQELDGIGLPASHETDQ